jgi:hypothetical protein
MSLRTGLTTAVLLAGGLLLADDQAPPERSENSRESIQRVVDLAARYEFFADQDRKIKFERHAKPILTYSNPIRGDVLGNVFVWTHDGRPAMIGAIFDFRSEDKFDSEFHSLSRRGVVATRDGKPFWNPEQPGIAFQPVPAAPPPEETASVRARQMRELIRGFSVERDHPEQGQGPLRMLTQPIYRYTSPETEVSEGAVFVFVEGTDPEAFVLLEAIGKEKPVWQFAFARMNIVEFRGSYQGRVVWQVPPAEWDTVFDRQEPYAIVREKPSRGLVRRR